MEEEKLLNEIITEEAHLEEFLKRTKGFPEEDIEVNLHIATERVYILRWLYELESLKDKIQLKNKNAESEFKDSLNFSRVEYFFLYKDLFSFFTWKRFVRNGF